MGYFDTLLAKQIQKKEYTIGEFSQITRFSIKTLRYYDEMELLIPWRKDETSGYRYYNEESISKAHAIGLLKSFDFTLKEIKEMILGAEEDENLLVHLTRKTEEISAKIKQYGTLKKHLEKMTHIIEENETMKNYEKEIKTIQAPSQWAATIRYKGKYEDTGKYISRLFKEYGSRMAGRPFNLYWDEEFKETDADIELCLPVKKDTVSKTVPIREIPPGQYIAITHIGGYDTLGESYKALMDYCKSHALEYQKPIREIYLKGPGMFFRGNPDKYITEIRFLMK